MNSCNCSKKENGPKWAPARPPYDETNRIVLTVQKFDAVFFLKKKGKDPVEQ